MGDGASTPMLASTRATSMVCLTASTTGPPFAWIGFACGNASRYGVSSGISTVCRARWIRGLRRGCTSITPRVICQGGGSPDHFFERTWRTEVAGHPRQVGQGDVGRITVLEPDFRAGRAAADESIQHQIV